MLSKLLPTIPEALPKYKMEKGVYFSRFPSSLLRPRLSTHGSSSINIRHFPNLQSELQMRTISKKFLHQQSWIITISLTARTISSDVHKCPFFSSCLEETRFLKLINFLGENEKRLSPMKKVLLEASMILL